MFMASLIVRSIDFRMWMQFELLSPRVDNFLETICMYMVPADQPEERIKVIKEFAPKDRLNHASYCIWHHLKTRMCDQSFNMVLIENIEHGWETCDDPVSIRHNRARGGSLLGRATEIIFPICKEWCLFMYDPKYRYPLNPLCQHPHGAMIKADAWIRFFVRERMLENAVQHLFFSHPHQYAGCSLH